jgi:hypothetical protein
LRQPQTIALYRLCVQSRFETAMSDNALNIFIQNIISGYQDMGVTAQAMAVQPDLRKRIKITDKAKEPAWTHDQSKRMEIL